MKNVTAWGASIVIALSLGELSFGTGVASAAVVPPEVASSLSIKIESSRPRSTAGSGLGIIAEVKNTSKSADAYIAEGATILFLPPELQSQAREQRGYLRGKLAFFPTEPDFKRRQSLPVVVRLRPGASYKVFWTTADPREPDPKPNVASSLFGPVFGWLRRAFDSSALDLVASELTFLFFQPGEYTVAVETKYWTKLDDANSQNDNYYLANDSLKIGRKHTSLTMTLARFPPSGCQMISSVDSIQPAVILEMSTSPWRGDERPRPASEW